MPELRYTASDFELRGQRGEGATLVGYAAVFDSPTTIAGLFREQVGRRAFNKTIKEHDIRALFNHDPGVVLGRNRAGTLRLSTDDHGLVYEVDLPETQQARDLWTLIDRGDVTQSSFAFDVVKQQVSEGDEGELPLRTLKEVRLYDVSPVTFPAYEDTEVEARARAVLESITAELRATTEEPPAEPPQTLGDTPQPEPDAPRGLSVYVARLRILEKEG